MLPKLGKAIAKPRSFQLKKVVQGTLINRAVILTPSLGQRAFSIGTINTAQKDEVIEKMSKTTIPVTKPVMTEASVFESLNEFKNTGNLKGAIRIVRTAKDLGVATPAIYIYLVDMLRELPFDIESCATVAHWFYSDSGKVPLDVMQDMKVWKSVLRLGFRFGATYRVEDLRAIVDKFTETFDLTTMNDQTAWELLMRAYGMMNRSDAITACLAKNEQPAKKKSFYSSAILSYANTKSNDKVQELLSTLQQEDLVSRQLILKLARCYGFQGDIAETTKYIKMCNQLYPDNPSDNTMLLVAHKVALETMCQKLEYARGARGLDLKPKDSSEIDELHASWNNLTKDMFIGEKTVDITDCNVVLEYLTIANRIDPIEFPMKKAETIFETYMPAHNIKPNDASHRVMLVGYAKSREYNEGGNVRLDKTLEVVSKMQIAGINTLDHPTFHALFRACIPHRNGQYYYDNFRLNSLLPPRPQEHYHFKLDARVFEIEKIMLEAHIPHDRHTFSTLITCLAAGKQNQALRSRWRNLKSHGLKRDIGLYRSLFALASLDYSQAKAAMVVVKSEMDREIKQNKVDWATYTAMLDCCITAQLPVEAKEIMNNMRKAATDVNKYRNVNDISKWPYLDSPEFYLPMLRAAVSIQGLNQTAEKILNELDSKNVVDSQGIWEAKLSKLALEDDRQGIQQLFNKYTMSRFEKQGNIPVPIRENTSPIMPFLTAPYTRLDMEFIDVYLSTLVDNQDVSLVFDALRILNDQTDIISISTSSLNGITRLAKQEGSVDELKWLSTHILPKIKLQNKTNRGLKKNIDFTI